MKAQEIKIEQSLSMTLCAPCRSDWIFEETSEKELFEHALSIIGSSF